MHALSGTWRLTWTQKRWSTHQDLRHLSHGLLPKHTVRVRDICQEISVERGTWMDIADLQLAGGYECTWIAFGRIETLPSSVTTFPFDVLVTMRAGHLIPQDDDLPAEPWLAPFMDRTLLLPSGGVPARTEIVCIGTESRVDADREGSLALLRRL